MKQQQIINLLKSIGIYSRQGASDNLIVCCPLAEYRELHQFNKDNKPSMGILVKDAEPCIIHCFTCGYKNISLAKMLLELQQYRLDDQALDVAIDQATLIELPSEDEVLSLINDITNNQARNNGNYLLPKYEEDTPLDTSLWDTYKKKYHKYFEDRGITLDTCKDFESGYDREKKRVMLPVYDKNNILRGAVGRSIIPNIDPKYLNYWEFNKGKYLMGEHLIHKNNILIITEGMFDLLKGYQYLKQHDLLGTYSIVALMGARLTDIQAITIVKLAGEVVLFLDNDDVGRENSKHIATLLAKSIMVTGVNWSILKNNKKDLGELSYDEFDTMLNLTEIM
ncbi:Toprim-like [uncultured Caudovirales phage]|uniref:Toprim-like n=1 Tax=uncultured Caudovirales phage TaxID=2100421 RepID=A0A6J7X5U6_9CAUD|nr:Toprim-like [uncultured Caudovirales phage]